MLKCAYAIFCEDVNLNASTNQISAMGFFSKLELEEPGTTQFSFIIGVWGVKKGRRGKLELLIVTPDGRALGGSWTSPESSDENEVYSAIFNCGKIPFNAEGDYIFRVVDSNNKTQEITRRILSVTFSSKGGSE